MITKRSISRLIAVLLFVSVFYNDGFAQVTAARTAMQNLYVLYDSTPYITFDVNYTYSTDTVYNEFTRDMIAGTYTMNGQRAKFTLGDVEYMQNDSLFITTYHKDKIIVVTRARQAIAGQYMPLRSSIDSLLNAYNAHYSITVQDNEGDTSGYVKFTKADSLATFDQFNIYFNKDRHCINTVEYVFYEQDDVNDSLSKMTFPPRRKKLQIDFLNYRFDNFSESVYDTNNYVWNDEGELKPVAKLEGYKVYDAR